MKFRTVLVIFLALVCGVSAAVGTSHLRNQEVKPVQGEMVTTVVASVPIARGVVISPDMVATRECPKEHVQEGTVTQLQDVIGRVAFIPLLKGEPLLEGKMAPKNSGRGLAALIPKGMQAVAIQTPNVATGVAGFIMPGNHVDVLLTFGGRGSAEPHKGTTIRLLQNVEILAVDQRVDAPAENKVDPKELRSVTLLVTPRQAAMLALGQSKGSLQLALRNPQDELDAKSGPVTPGDIGLRDEKGPLDTLPVAAAAVAPPTLPRPPLLTRVRTLRGVNEGMVLMPASGDGDDGN
jgi:pilus assembly protein CpaB